MKTLISLLLLFCILLLQGCIQAPSNGRKTSLSSSSTSTTLPTIYPTFATDESLYWFTTAKITGTVTINKNSQDIIYLRGKLVHDFLSAKDLSGVEYYRKQYCILGKFGTDTAYKQLRVRAIPIYVTTSSKAIERLLRIDIPSETDNTSACSFDTTSPPNGNLNYPIIAYNPNTTSFSLPKLCSVTATNNCLGQVTSTELPLYYFDNYHYGTPTYPKLLKIDSTLFSLSSTPLKVDLQSNSTDPNSSCTNSSCSAKGFDCCISGQCVKDASYKTNASTDPQYTQATIDYAANPLSFINYPNIFYICSNISHTPAATTPPTTTPVSDAQARVAKYLDDYTCISDVAAGKGYVPNCKYYNALVPSTATSINNTEAAYIAIKKKLAIACGCTAGSDQSADYKCIIGESATVKDYSSCRDFNSSGAPTAIDKSMSAFNAIKLKLYLADDQVALKCPDWGVVPVYPSGALKTNANITDFNCYTPTPVNQIGPITNLNVNVPNRSAPHRFYSSAGINYDDIAGLLTKFPGTIQEGYDFYYLDEYNKVGPINEKTFNINSVLGKMTLDLSHTAPAKVVTVELGKTYIISATSGYFTPCSQCVKDSWFQTFSAYPTTQRGVGLQATGYTTSRDTYSGNTTFGNYEDTIFGRACYVPVTMLPFSHQKNGDLQIQRQNRLATQTAFYVNGYQRDWYGFNKGALIGSYDGVTWFAIGTGRRVTATSTKLFLALNASFLDLADKTDTIVNIIPDFSSNIAADYDYDPDIALTDPRQNTGATCQRFHQCVTDTDCVAQLGWEYTCTDVSQFKTKWPMYDSSANEIKNQENSGSLFEILQSTISTSNGKRCVYRGAGAPCKGDYNAGTTEYTKKSLTCAPNFYCASLTTNKFNDELVRSPNELSDILFGMDTKILGRPLHYVTAGKSLTNEIVSNITYNATNAIGITGGDMGICRPGKQLSGTALSNHQNADISKRTDYISQIGSCDSMAKNAKRFVTCPAFDDTLNYADPVAANTIISQVTQNSCGGEAKNTSTYVSAFQNIEGLSLINLQNITQPILAQDACLRRAGSVCHTDLDCGPNKMHEDAVGAININFFGGTEAEQNYWRESLICGQSSAAPLAGATGYLDYKLSENRCCREIGKDFTMYTEGPNSIVPENLGSNLTLKTAKFPFVNAAFNTDPDYLSGPAAKNRYSRYTISLNAINSLSKIPKVTASAEPALDQWHVVNETGSLTCCGGGWIRKFADGTHDWNVRNRLSIDANNFTCLNFRSPLANSGYNTFVADKVVSASYQREYEYFCKTPGEGCLQIKYQDSLDYNIYSPRAYDPSLNVKFDAAIGPFKPTTKYARIDTTLVVPSGSTEGTQVSTVDSPYVPVPFIFQGDLTKNPDSGTAENYFFVTKDKSIQSPGVSFYLPAYVGYDGTLTDAATPGSTSFIGKVYIKYNYTYPRSPLSSFVPATLASTAQCDAAIKATTGLPVSAITTGGANGNGTNTWCIVNNRTTGNRPVVIVKAETTAEDATNLWSSAGVIIDFMPIEQFNNIKVTEPGNALYYLSKLARLELLGIPQITYEPLYCNNNRDLLVPGIFKSILPDRSKFNDSSVNTNSYTATYNSIETYKEESSSQTETSQTEAVGIGNVEKRFSFQDKVDHAAIFSAKDFTCCTPLGKTTTSATKCCSGFAVTSTDGKSSTCKIPKGADLNVYFNKFVSGEGVGVDLPGGGLVVKRLEGDTDDRNLDFNPYTGEPKFQASTTNKLFALGSAYCDGTVVTGGAFGTFPPEPFSGSYAPVPGATGDIEKSFPESIVDSVMDFSNTDANLGKVPFDSGYRWNHHLYCK